MNSSSIGHAEAVAPSMVGSEAGRIDSDSFLDTSSDGMAQSWADLLELQVECFADGEVSWLGSLPAWQRAERVLDVGCGQGSFTAALQESFPGKRYVGIDVSERLIERAKARSRSVYFQVADLTDFRPERPFDVVVMRFVLQHLPDLGNVLLACRRLLREGGMLVVIEPSLARSHNTPPTPRFVEMLSAFEAKRAGDGFLKARTAELADEIDRIPGWTASTEVIPVQTSGSALDRVSVLYESWIAMIEASAADPVGGHAVRGELADWRTSEGAVSHIALSATVVTPV